MTNITLPKRQHTLMLISHSAARIQGPYTEGGGGQQGQLHPQRRLNLQFLFYFKYIEQDKSCLIFKYIGTLSSFAPWQKNPAYGPGRIT